MIAHSLHFMHYGIIAAITALTGLGVGIGQGLTANATMQALDRQPAAKSDIARSNLLALALIETSSLIGLLFSMLLFLKVPSTYYGTLAQLGIAAALAIPGFTLGIIASMPARAAIMSIARQPFLGKKIMNLMLLTQSLIQTPLVFGFIISLMIRNQLEMIHTLPDAMRLIASGLCIALGSIGPAIGIGYFTRVACQSVGNNRLAYNKIFSFTLISQAIIETPIIFAAVIAFWLSTAVTAGNTLPSLLYIAIAFVMGMGTFGTGISSGLTAAAACNQIAQHPAEYATISRASIFTQAIIDTGAIYAFIVAILLLLARF